MLKYNLYRFLDKEHQLLMANVIATACRTPSAVRTPSDPENPLSAFYRNSIGITNLWSTTDPEDIPQILADPQYSLDNGDEFSRALSFALLRYLETEGTPYPSMSPLESEGHVPETD